MADAKKTKNLVRLACSVCHRVNYRTKKSKRMILEQVKFKFNKYCNFDRRHTAHEEAK
jgi:large subunit ribosomal protein L33